MNRLPLFSIDRVSAPPGLVRPRVRLARFLFPLMLVALAAPLLADTGLDFPSNAEVGDYNSYSPRFKWVSPEQKGLPMYGPNDQGATYIWEYYPKNHAGYYTTFFYACDNNTGELPIFYGCDQHYYGAHPYPRSQNGSGTTHDWELAADGDNIGPAVSYNRWYTQALVVWVDSSGYKHHKFYTNLPNVDGASTITAVAGSKAYGEDSPSVSPQALTWGGAPWAPGQEVGHGIHRGIRIYDKLLSEADILIEANSPLSTSEGAAHIWYMNLNPTPTDISDQSGKGHHPAWVGSARPSLWDDGGGLEPPSPPGNLRVETP